MEIDYVVLPIIIVGVCLLVVWLCADRFRALAHKPFPTWRKVGDRILLSMVIVTLTALAVNCAYNAIAIQMYRAANPPLGLLYSVNGHKMQLRCVGSGSPTIVLESGLGVSTDALVAVEFQNKLATTTRICAYDRAGLGWSEPAPGPGDADQIAADLHTLLAEAGEHGPFVLTGHSFGGIYLRDYQAHYPENVEGLILLDSSTPLQERRFAALTGTPGEQNLTPMLMTMRVLYTLGVPRLMGWCGRPLKGMDPRRGKAMGEDACQPGEGVIKEMSSMTQSGLETVHTGPFGALPILIISEDTVASNAHKGALAKRTGALWDQMQEELKMLSTRSRRIIAKGSGHMVQTDREDLVVREVQLFVDQIRGTAPEPANYGSTITE